MKTIVCDGCGKTLETNGEYVEMECTEHPQHSFVNGTSWPQPRRMDLCKRCWGKLRLMSAHSRSLREKKRDG